MKMCIGGEWVDANKQIEVRHPFDDSLVDTVPRATVANVERAIETAVLGAKASAKLTAYERSLILKRTAAYLEARADDFARTITMEEGKPITEARVEVSRSVQTLNLSAEEALRLHGETIPLDGAPNGAGKFGITLRVPCGVVVAISPFNFPLNLVAHKVGPAIAAGNAVIIKPPSATPLSALKLTELLLEANFPPAAISCLTGSGTEIGEALCADPRVRKISFTGSRDVGERICKIAGIKRVTMELGSNSPLIVMPDADVQKAAVAIASTGYSNAGQVCISTQRVLVSRELYGDLIVAAKREVEKLVVGNPFNENTQVASMISEHEARRVEAWINDAVQNGGRLITGGMRKAAIYIPTVVADVPPHHKISCDELFGPAVAITPFASTDEAISLVNGGRYGLAAGVFTENLDTAMRLACELEVGNIHINWGPQWRADLMPYGGLKESGFGKEGPRYAIEEMTELKMVCFHLKQ